MKQSIIFCLCLFLTLKLCLLPARADATPQRTPISQALSDLPDGDLPKGTLLSVIEESETGDMRLYLWDLRSKLTLHNDGRAMYGLSSQPHSLSAVNRRARITNLYKLTDDIVYTVYTMCGDDNNLYCVYTFFESLDPAINGHDPVTEYWWMTDRVFFVHDILSYQDFSAVVPGSTAAFVTAIDPAAGLQLISMDETKKEIDEQTSCHYLTDGILYLTYRPNEEKTELIVTDIRFDPAFTLSGFQNTTHNTTCALPQQQAFSEPETMQPEIQVLLKQRWNQAWCCSGSAFYILSAEKRSCTSADFSQIQIGNTTENQVRSLFGTPHIFVGGTDWKAAYCTTDGYLIIPDYREDGVLTDLSVYHSKWHGSRSWLELHPHPQPASLQTPHYIYVIIAVILFTGTLGCSALRRQ